MCRDLLMATLVTRPMLKNVLAKTARWMCVCRRSVSPERAVSDEASASPMSLIPTTAVHNSAASGLTKYRLLQRRGTSAARSITDRDARSLARNDVVQLCDMQTPTHQLPFCCIRARFCYFVQVFHDMLLGEHRASQSQFTAKASPHSA
jgi:hypothetical protein